MRIQWITWITLAANLGSGLVNLWLIRRTLKIRERDRQASAQAIDAAMREVAPAIAFCAMIRDNPNLHESVRKAAGSAIPKFVTIYTEVTAIAPGSHKLH